MVDSHGVPQDMEALVAQYEPFIKWAIKRYSKKRLSREEAEDARQQVYVRVLKYDFLSRCRSYYTTHPGRFTTSLSMLIRNMLLSRVKKDPLAGAVSFTRAKQRRDEPQLPAFMRDTKADRAAAVLDAKIRAEQVTRRLRRALPSQRALIDTIVADPSKVPTGRPTSRWQQIQRVARSLEAR